jgi:hypothetical protein
MQKKISCDFVIFYEHVDREYAVAKLLENKIAKLSNKRGLILSIIYQRHLLLKYKPKLIIFPSLSWIEINSIYYIYSSNVDLVCLNYEQMLSDFNRNVKAPQGEVIKTKVLHFAWSDQYSDYLIQHGVTPDKIRIVDKYIYQILSEKNIHGSSIDKKILANYKKIVFVPLTDLQAFKNNDRIKKEFGNGPNYQSAIKRRDFVLASIKIILQWIYDYASTNTEICFIIRPHPSVGIENYKLLLRSEALADLENVIYNYEGAAIDFFDMTDVLITNYSSLLLDANYYGVESLILEPLPFPVDLAYDWFDNFKRITSYLEFESSIKKCLNNPKTIIHDSYCEKSVGIDVAVRNIMEWAASMNGPHDKLNKLNYKTLINLRLIKFFVNSMIRLFFLKYFRFLLNENFMRDGIKIKND